MLPHPEAFFLPTEGNSPGQRFCLFHASQEPIVRGSILYIHPFTEEMNKSRRMAALQSRALARAGYDVLQIDLLGCGDSSGDFGDATWQEWVSDVLRGCDWLRSRTKPRAAGPGGTARSQPSSHNEPHATATANTPPPPRPFPTEPCTTTPPDTPPLWLWGLRAGCLLAVDAAKQLNEPCNFLFWQPPSSGKPLLQQFLRLKVAGDMLGGQAKGVMEDMRQQLASGTSVEIAGYMLSAGLASGMEQAALLPPAIASDPQEAVMRPLTASAGPAPTAHQFPAGGSRQTRRLEWLELSTREDASLSPVSTKTIAQWQQAGYATRSHIVNGPSFWQTTEIEDAPALIAATTAALANGLP